MNIGIEPITEKDFGNLLMLFKEFAQFENLEKNMTNSLEQMQQDKDLINGFILKNENEIIGYVTYFFAYYTWTGKSLYMDDLYIRPNYRGKGLGTKLIDEMIAFAHQAKCSRLRWQVSNWNHSAIKFYESLGAEINPIEMNCEITF